VRAFLLAAGLGTRMGAITRSTPKCLLPVAGKPLLGRWFDLLAKAGVTHALVNTHHLAEPVRAYVASCDPPLAVTLVHEPILLGSAGTLRANRDFAAAEQRFLVVYADNASSVDLRALVRAHRADSAATLGLFRVPDPQTRGIVELEAAGTVVGFVEKPERPKSNLAWAGLLVGTPELLDAIPDRTPCDLGHDVLPRLVGRMHGFEIEGYHRDVGTPESYQQACSDLSRLGSAA
jgi:mannose-1-phosphate guanylyltransferase